MNNLETILSTSDNFKQFLKDNKSELIDYAEGMKSK